MVRAILEGRKTQTRRVLKQRQNPHEFLGGIGEDKNDPHNWGFENPDVPSHFVTLPEQRSPYGQVGDQLWVRETWATSKSLDHVKPSDLAKGAPIQYIADQTCNVNNFEEKSLYNVGKSRPSIFMPRWASRINLMVTNVRVERLLDITQSDACAEGVALQSWFQNNAAGTTPIKQFKALWQSINGVDSWDKNPWVWVVEFQRKEI